MSAERRRREDSHPAEEWVTQPQGRVSGGEAGSAEFQPDTGPLGGGDGDWPGDSRLDQAWAGSYQFDGRPSDEPWRGQGGDSPPADAAWRDDTPPADEDDWVARTQADQSWRYRSLADDDQAEDRDDWPGSGPAAASGPGNGMATGRRASDGWPASAADPFAADGPSADPFATDAPAADPFATDLYAGDYPSGGRRPGTHVVGGRRASDSWLAGTGADQSVPAVGGRSPGGLTAGEASSGAGASGRNDSGGDDGDWDDGGNGRPGRRRRILVSVLAAVAVALAFGTYGLIRVHDDTLALQDAARPCAAHAGRCHSRSPRTPGPGSGSPVVSNSGVPGPSGSPTTRASGRPTGTPSTAPSHPAAPASTPASVPPPTHSAAPPPKPAPAPSASATQPTGTVSSAAAAQVLAVINQARAQQGLPALTVSSGLNASSAAHTSVMAGGCGLSHQCAGEPPLGTRLTNAGVQWTSAGENIGEGGPEADTTAAITQMAVGLTQGMLNEQPPDDGHRMNILSPSFQFVGITVFLDSHGTVWMTQDFSG
jgi:uncharacterized protein YkwD